MKSPSVFVIGFAWWMLGAATLGVLYPVVLIVGDAFLSTGTSDTFDPRISRALVTSVGYGLALGAVPAIANVGLSSLLQHRPRAVESLTRLLAGVWTVFIVWRALEASPDMVERVGATTILGFAAWVIAPAIARRNLRAITPRPREIDEPPSFQPTHVLTSNAHSDDVDNFVRNSLRTYGRGNALFTVEAGGPGNAPSTQILVDAGGTGHVLNLDVKPWQETLADGAEELPGFLVTDDRTLAIAPAGLSASAVVSEGISLVQSVSGARDVKVQFEGFGH